MIDNQPQPTYPSIFFVTKQSLPVFQCLDEFLFPVHTRTQEPAIIIKFEISIIY